MLSWSSTETVPAAETATVQCFLDTWTSSPIVMASFPPKFLHWTAHCAEEESHLVGDQIALPRPADRHQLAGLYLDLRPDSGHERHAKAAVDGT